MIQYGDPKKPERLGWLFFGLKLDTFRQRKCNQKLFFKNLSCIYACCNDMYINIDVFSALIYVRLILASYM